MRSLDDIISEFNTYGFSELCNVLDVHYSLTKLKDEFYRSEKYKKGRRFVHAGYALKNSTGNHSSMTESNIVTFS